jgi:predicted phage tail component-like protein
MKGLTFNERHSSDFGLVLESKSIQPPSKKKIKVNIPFMNGSYDFSNLGTNGEVTYTERVITVVLGLPTRSKIELHLLYSQILLWLQDVVKSQLTFDDITDCYYMAEVETAPSFDELNKFGKLTVTFIAEPFKFGKDYVGQEHWDNLNFETDTLQNELKFNINETQPIIIYNPGRIISPEVIVSSNMSCSLNGYTANFTTNKSKDYRFKLQNGNNNISINGTGNIEFRFRKQVL